MKSTIRLELSEGTANKFWEASVSGATLSVHFGRIGTVGQAQEKTLGSEALARAAFDKLVAEKTKKGYRAATKGKKAPLPAKSSAKAGGKPAPSGSALAGPLAELEKLLPGKKRRAATPSEIASLAKLLGDVPADLLALYAFSANLDTVFGDVDGLEWLGIRGAVGNFRDNRKLAKNAETLFTIATDGGGNFSCFDTASGRILDWDHETRETRTLAPSLGAYLMKQVLPGLRRASAETVALAREKGKTIAVASTIPMQPSKLTRVPSAVLAKFDRESYGGGAHCALFLDDQTVFLSVQNSSLVVNLITQKSVDVWHGGAAAAFDPRSGRILVGEWGALRILDGKTKTKTTLARWQSDLGHFGRIRFSPDGSLASVSGVGRLVQLWDMKGLKGIPKEVTSPITATYNLPKGKPLAALAGHSEWVSCASFSPDGARLVSGDGKGRLCVFDVAKKKLVKSVVFKSEEISAAAFSHDGTEIFVGLASGKVLVTDPVGKLTRQFRTEDAVRDLSVLSTGVVATLGSKSFTLWDPKTGKLLAKLDRKPGNCAAIAGERGNMVLLCGPMALVRVT